MITYDYTHDVALFMHAYYVNEIDVGARAIERLLDSNAPLNIQESAHQNQPFYMRPLAQTGIVDYHQLKIDPAFPGWSLFNPSIVTHKGKTIVNVRSSNYQIVGGRYIMPPEDHGMIRTENILATIEDGRVTNTVKMQIPEYRKTGYSVDGMEDVRLFTAGDKLYASGTVRNVHPFDWMCRIGIVEVFDDGTTSPIQVIMEPVKGRHEKNWMPVVGSESPKWLYDCGFHIQKTLVADPSTKLIDRPQHVGEVAIDMSERPAPQQARRFRGSSQLVPYKHGYVAVIHEVHNYHGARVYSHRLVEFDSEFKISRFSNSFFLKDPRTIEFCAGITLKGNHAVLSFGVQDSEAWLAKLPLFTLEAMLDQHHF